MKLKFNFNKRNRYKNICSIEGCNNSACGKYCNKHYHQIKRYGNIKTRTRFDKNEIIINDNVAKILLYDNNCNVIDYTINELDKIHNPIDHINGYTHLFGYLNPYYRSAYNVSKRRK